jgi:hypothetical protein
MTPTGERPAFEGMPHGARPRRWPRYTLGALLAFIAGMAVMLALLLPFLPWASPPPVIKSHFGGMVAAQDCAKCHAAIPAAPAR